MSDTLQVPSFLYGSARDADKRMDEVFRRMRGVWPKKPATLEYATVPFGSVLVAGPRALETLCTYESQWRVVDILLLLGCISNMRISLSVMNARERAMIEELVRCPWAALTVVASKFCRTPEVAVRSLRTICSSDEILSEYQWQLYDTPASAVSLDIALGVLLRKQCLSHGIAASESPPCLSHSQLASLIVSLEEADVSFIVSNVIGIMYDEHFAQYFGEREAVDPDGRVLNDHRFLGFVMDSPERVDLVRWSSDVVLRQYLRDHGIERRAQSFG